MEEVVAEVTSGDENTGKVVTTQTTMVQVPFRKYRHVVRIVS